MYIYRSTRIKSPNFFVLSFLLLGGFVKGQSPGNVTNPSFWLKADAGVTQSSGSISQWNDQSANAYHVSEATASLQPLYNTNTINYYAVPHFDAVDDHLMNLSVPYNGLLNAVAGTTDNTTGSIFTVAKLLSLSNNARIAYQWNAVPSGDFVFQSFVDITTGALKVGGRSATVASGTNAVTALNPFIATGLEAPGANGAEHYYNGGNKKTVTNASNFIYNGTNWVRIGGSMGGDVAEVITYSTKVTDAQRIKIESYLALKYSITLNSGAGGAAGNYVASDGTTTIWTASTSSVYHNGVIGIGRDDNSALTQKQSHQIDDSTRIYISSLASTNAANTGSFSANNQFVMMGHNGGALANNGSTEYVTGISSRISREWKITNTAFTGTFSIDIKLATACGTFTNDLKLLIDTDDNFSSGATIASGVTFSYSSGVITIGGITTSHIPQSSTRYVTLATGTVTTGSIAADQVILSGTSPANLILSGNSNPTGYWQYSTNNFVSSTTIPTSASSTLTSAQMGSLTVNTYYRAFAETNALCATVNPSSVALVQVMSSAPGGVVNKIYLWTKANTGVVTSGTTANVSQWTNQALTPMTTQALISSATPSIILDNSKFNYEPCVHFTGASGKYLEGTFASSVLITNPGVFFLVSQPTTAAACCKNPVSFDPISQSIGYGDDTDDTYGIDYSGGNCSKTTSKTDVRGIVRADFASASNTSLTVLSFNSVSNTACGSFGVGTASGLFQIGGRPYGGLPGRVFPGDIAEVIYYHDNNTLTTTEIQKIESYLALKYGISLAANYLNAGGSTIYSVTGSYTNNIIGIIRDDASGLNHKQSHTLDDTVRVYLGTLATTNADNASSFSSNLSSVMLGANNGKMCSRSITVTEKPSSIYSLLDREWEITNTNFSSTFNMDFKLNSCALPSTVTASHLRLLVDNDGDFTNATVYESGGGLSISYSNPVITVTGISTTQIAAGTSKFITVGSTNAGTPLPLELLFFKAECAASFVKLSWQTASELNNAYFTIERSEDGVEWQTLGKTAGSGTSKNTKMYEYYVTGDARKNDNYYRLKQTDLDGNFTYFETIEFTNNCTQAKSDVSVYPDPFDDNLFIRGKNLQSYVILNAVGQPVLSGRLDTSSSDSGITHSIATDNLKEGFYFIQLFESNPNNKHCFKIVK